MTSADDQLLSNGGSQRWAQRQKAGFGKVIGSSSRTWTPNIPLKAPERGENKVVLKWPIMSLNQPVQDGNNLVWPMF